MGTFPPREGKGGRTRGPSRRRPLAPGSSSPISFLGRCRTNRTGRLVSFSPPGPSCLLMHFPSRLATPKNLAAPRTVLIGRLSRQVTANGSDSPSPGPGFSSFPCAVFWSYVSQLTGFLHAPTTNLYVPCPHFVSVK